MPAVSKAQRRFMGMCEHNPQHAKGQCPSKAVAAEFSHTSEKGLPQKKGRGKDKKKRKESLYSIFGR
jgi:hypothetical protein